MSRVIHKLGGKEHTAYGVYLGFGQYGSVVGPMCEGSKGLWKGRTYQCHRSWKYVTCKNCLKKKVTTEKEEN